MAEPLPAGAIVGIVLGVIGILLLLLCFFCYWRYGAFYITDKQFKKRKSTRKRSKKSTSSSVSKNDISQPIPMVRQSVSIDENLVINEELNRNEGLRPHPADFTEIFEISVSERKGSSSSASSSSSSSSTKIPSEIKEETRPYIPPEPIEIYTIPLGLPETSTFTKKPSSTSSSSILIHQASHDLIEGSSSSNSTKSNSYTSDIIYVESSKKNYSETSTSDQGYYNVNSSKNSLSDHQSPVMMTSVRKIEVDLERTFVVDELVEGSIRANTSESEVVIGQVPTSSSSSTFSEPSYPSDLIESHMEHPTYLPDLTQEIKNYFNDIPGQIVQPTKKAPKNLPKHVNSITKRRPFIADGYWSITVAAKNFPNNINLESLFFQFYLDDDYTHGTSKYKSVKDKDHKTGSMTKECFWNFKLPASRITNAELMKLRWFYRPSDLFALSNYANDGKDLHLGDSIVKSDDIIEEIVNKMANKRTLGGIKMTGLRVDLEDVVISINVNSVY